MVARGQGGPGTQAPPTSGGGRTPQPPGPPAGKETADEKHRNALGSLGALLATTRVKREAVARASGHRAPETGASGLRGPHPVTKKLCECVTRLPWACGAPEGKGNAGPPHRQGCGVQSDAPGVSVMTGRSSRDGP